MNHNILLSKKLYSGLVSPVCFLMPLISPTPCAENDTSVSKHIEKLEKNIKECVSNSLRCYQSVLNIHRGCECTVQINNGFNVVYTMSLIFC